MEHVKKEDSIRHTHSSQCTVYEYPMSNPEISIGLAEINGRYPDEGYALNHACSEIGYILKGTGKLVTQSKSIELGPGDAVCIPPNEQFYWKGSMTILLPTAPAWDPKQHEIISCSQETLHNY